MTHPHLWGRTDLERSFSAVYVPLHGPLHVHAERFLDRDAAKDAVSEAMVKAWLRWPHLTPEQRTEKYLFAAVHRAAIDAKRREKGRLPEEFGDDELREQADAAFEAAHRSDDRSEVLDSAIAALPPRRREVLLLVKEQSFSCADAGEVMGLATETIRTHLRLAIGSLRAAFARAGFSFDDRRGSSPNGGTSND